MHRRWQWAELTEPARVMAEAADRELRRRYPGAKVKSLAAAGPAATASSPRGAEWISPALTGLGEPGHEPAQIFLNIEEKRFARGSSAAAVRLPGLGALDIDPVVAGRLAGIAGRARQAQRAEPERG